MAKRIKVLFGGLIGCSPGARLGPAPPVVPVTSSRRNHAALADVDHLVHAGFDGYAKGELFRDATANLIDDGLFAARL